MNTAGAVDGTAIGGLINSHTATSTLPLSFAGLSTFDPANSLLNLGNASSRCVDKLNELYNERGVYGNSAVPAKVRNTGNATGSYSDNLSLTAIMSDTKKRLA